MAEARWIKVVTDVFDDDKILLIESMPEADGILVIWFKLLCLAGKQNNSGVFLMNGSISYTSDMFSTIFRRDKALVQLALDTFEKFGMIEIVDGVVTIPNWGKHQSLDQLENKKEYMRNYMREYRQKQKSICKSNGKTTRKKNVNFYDELQSKDFTPFSENTDETFFEENENPDSCNKEISTHATCKTNSRANVSSADKNRIDKNNSIRDVKHAYGEYKKIKLTDAQYQRLCNDYGESMVLKAIKKVDEYKQTYGKTYADDNLVLRKWGFDGLEKEVEGPKKNYI